MDIVITTTERLIVWFLTPSVTLFQSLYRVDQCTYPCFLGVFLISTPHNVLSNPLAAFPHNHCQNNRQQGERIESCDNDYHQSSERILGEPVIQPATYCSQTRNANDCTMELALELTDLHEAGIFCSTDYCKTQ